MARLASGTYKPVKSVEQQREEEKSAVGSATGDKDAVANQHQSNMGTVDSQRRTLGAPDPTKMPNTDNLKNNVNQSISDINKNIMFGQSGASYKTGLNRLADVISNKQSVVFRTLVATEGAKNAPKSFSRTSTKRLRRPRNFIRCWSRPETGGTLMNEDVEKTLTRNIAAFNLKRLTEAIANLIKDNS